MPTRMTAAAAAAAEAITESNSLINVIGLCILPLFACLPPFLPSFFLPFLHSSICQAPNGGAQCLRYLTTTISISPPSNDRKHDDCTMNLFVARVQGQKYLDFDLHPDFYCNRIITIRV